MKIGKDLLATNLHTASLGGTDDVFRSVPAGSNIPNGGSSDIVDDCTATSRCNSNRIERTRDVFGLLPSRNCKVTGGKTSHALYASYMSFCHDFPGRQDA